MTTCLLVAAVILCSNVQPTTPAAAVAVLMTRPAPAVMPPPVERPGPVSVVIPIDPRSVFSPWWLQARYAHLIEPPWSPWFERTIPVATWPVYGYGGSHGPLMWAADPRLPCCGQWPHGGWR